MKIALLIPCTSNRRNEWTTIYDSYLHKLSLKTFLLTQDSEHEYCFYIGFDSDDRIFSKNNEQEKILRYKNAFKNIDFKFISFDIEKGYLTKMWNVLYNHAYTDGYEYFYQCGDDIEFTTKGWVNSSIDALMKNNNIGISGPINNNARILTQVMVSRKHMDIFGFFFPEEIKNWCCDDWYNFVYSPTHFFPLVDHYCSNNGNEPRYNINNDIRFVNNFQKNLQSLRNFTYNLAERHKPLISKYIIKL